jgi:hypothetical protein
VNSKRDGDFCFSYNCFRIFTKLSFPFRLQSPRSTTSFTADSQFQFLIDLHTEKQMSLLLSLTAALCSMKTLWQRTSLEYFLEDTSTGSVTTHWQQGRGLHKRSRRYSMILQVPHSASWTLEHGLLLCWPSALTSALAFWRECWSCAYSHIPFPNLSWWHSWSQTPLHPNAGHP